MNYDFLEVNAQAAATHLNLSEYGAICISYFPDFAHEECLKKFKSSKPVRTNSVKDKLSFYIYILNQFIADNNIELDITKKYDLMNDLGIHGDTAEYLPKEQQETQLDRLRKNPYSIYYTGPVSGSNRVASPLKLNPTSKANCEGNSKQDLSKVSSAPQPPQVAAAPPRHSFLNMGQIEQFIRWGIKIDPEFVDSEDLKNIDPKYLK